MGNSGATAGSVLVVGQVKLKLARFSQISETVRAWEAWGTSKAVIKSKVIVVKVILRIFKALE
jgi:hypothetical protein